MPDEMSTEFPPATTQLRREARLGVQSPAGELELRVEDPTSAEFVHLCELLRDLANR